MQTINEIDIPDSDIELKDSEFRLFSRLIYEKAGINIQQHKRPLVKNRLGKRIREGKFRSFKQYYDYMVNDKTGHEIVTMIDTISTNVTNFFRENQHFEFIKEQIIPELIKKRKNRRYNKFRIWSAACSSGEEPYSIAITFMQNLEPINPFDFMILGSDISTKVLGVAEKGVYKQEKVQPVPKIMRMRYFTQIKKNNMCNYQIKDEVKKYLMFRRINLITRYFPFKNPIDIIFCRNVMIYFDKPTQSVLVNKFNEYLEERGYLFLGHSEGLTGVDHSFRYIMPSVYRKE